MADSGPDEHHRHAGDPDYTADVEEQVLVSEEADHGTVEERDVADAQQQTQFGRAEAPERQVEGADRVGGQVDLDRKQEVADQQAKRDREAHIAGESEPAEEEERADRIADVID